MIESYFKWHRSLSRLLATPAGPYLSPLATELEPQGFTYWILRRRLQGAAHFSHWNQRQGRLIEQLHEDLLKDFETHLRACQCRRPLRASGYEKVGVLAGARALVEHLRDRGVITSPPPSKEGPDPPALFLGFCDWMRSQRGVQDQTLRRYGIGETFRRRLLR